MSYRMLALVACLLMCVGCQKTTPPTSAAGDAPPSPSSSPAAPAAVSADPAAPVATLLGKPVYRRDFYGVNNPVAAENQFQRLILAALTDDFCRREVAALSPAEIDAFCETWQPAAEHLSGKKPPVPAFHEAKIQTQLDETRAKLANKDAPWLGRQQLEWLERSLSFALQHKTVAAHKAYDQLMSLRCQKALYEKYGGKVVGTQTSMEPVGAYQKLIEEAEASGQLKFYDAALEQSFRSRMNEIASRQEVPPESVDFSLPASLQNALRPAVD